MGKAAVARRKPLIFSSFRTRHTYPRHSRRSERMRTTFAGICGSSNEAMPSVTLYFVIPVFWRSQKDQDLPHK